MIDQAILDRSNAAKRLLNNPDFQLIAAAIEADILANFRAVKIGDTETLANVHALSHGFKLLNDRMSKYIESASVAAKMEEISDE
ncbi:hypothetical protein [Neorhizobium sp. NCHU2750]|uniref:hypothetical protein n=1 Tax=Neorhizobium sp. NCHU2750 TaxID=1825976 RepID=UPI000E7644F6|nr:hypothetical protein NCHU2750_23490 [Neorhizobium sp. NCHU2750]